MRLIHKFFGLTLLSGVSIAGYLLIPPSRIGTSPKVEVSIIPKAIVAWKKDLAKEGYVAVDMNDEWEIFPGLLETFRKVKGIEEGRDKSELRKLCNAFEEQETLTLEEIKDAKRWCVKPREVEDILQASGRKLIHTVEERLVTWNEVKLRDLVKKYAENQEESLKMKSGRDNPKLLNISGDGNLDSFKQACEHVLGTRSFEDNLENKIKQAIEWCTEA